MDKPLRRTSHGRPGQSTVTERQGAHTRGVTTRKARKVHNLLFLSARKFDSSKRRAIAVTLSPSPPLPVHDFDGVRGA